jgi:hypothetical protein
MITELQIVDPKRACVPWWGNVEALKRLSSIPFTPGLNILWGPNGCGKSTILLTIARMMHCRQSGNSVVTKSSIHDLFPLSNPQDAMSGGVIPIHDGQSVRYFDPGNKVGVTGSQFDDDFMELGIGTMMAEKLSQGQQTLRGLSSALNVKPSAIRYTVSKDRANELWGSRIERVEQSLRPSIPKGPPTILLDEPDRSLALIYQGNFWQGASTAGSKKAQIIASSHSPFALFLSGANYIDLIPGYLEQCRNAVRMLAEDQCSWERGPQPPC